MGGLGTQGARVLVVLVVTVVVATVAAALALVGIDRAEVAATLLFVPVFAVGLLAGRAPGWVAAAGAALVHLALRSADVDEAGLAGVATVAATRAAAYVAAAEVGLRARSVVERLAAGNEWDDSPLVARGRAFSRRGASEEDVFGAGEPTAVWQAVPAGAPADAFDEGPPEFSEPGWPAEEPSAWPVEEPPGPAPAWAGEPSAWPVEEPAAWAVEEPPGPAPAWAGAPPAPVGPPAWSDPGGTPVVSIAEGQPWHPGARPGAVRPPGGAPRGPASTPPPAVMIDPETRLWTARFLRDRIAAEKAECDATGRPFSLILVQVPDEPFAALPYRRQLTLLRELGHQFVAGGVLDHLVHVPDQSQHWFAVVLPDIDRTSAQVLERRLRTGIGGYLRSRGLPLSELESASLTAPDDDPALGAIWDALAGREDGTGGARPRHGGAPPASGALAYDY